MKEILMAAMLVAAPVSAAENTAGSKAVDAIKAVFAQIDACIAKNDATCLGAFFTDDATYSISKGGAKLLKGKTEIINAIQGRMKDPDQGAKRKHSVQNVRLIGQDHAIVDCSVEFEGAKTSEGASAEAEALQRCTGVMALKGGKWLFEDFRSFGVEAVQSPTPVQPPASPSPIAPTQPVQPNVPAAPTQPARPPVNPQPVAPPTPNLTPR